MSAEEALGRLAEQVALISSGYHRLKKENQELQRQLLELSGISENSEELFVESPTRSKDIDREHLKTVLEKMLAELKDI